MDGADLMHGWLMDWIDREVEWIGWTDGWTDG